MGRLKVPRKTFIIRPQFGKANKPRIKWIFSYIVGNATVVLVCGIDQGSQVGENNWHLFRWKSEIAEYRYGRLHIALSIKTAVSSNYLCDVLRLSPVHRNRPATKDWRFGCV
jgi:hypothetical protein